MEEILKFFGGSAMLLTALAWLTREILKHWLSKDVDIFRAELSARYEKELALHKADLELQNQKANVTHSVLQARMLEVVEELHVKFTEFRNEAAVFAYSHVGSDLDEVTEQADKFIDSYFDFRRVYARYAVFLSPELERRFSGLHDEYFHKAISIVYGEDRLALQKELAKQSGPLVESSEQLAFELAGELRKLIGVVQ